MSYQVLARKWRPQLFSQLVGQGHVVTAISNALDNDRLHHAYLFTGTRGVGKTTIARIFSKSLNCESGQSSTPCGRCDTCLDIDQGRYVDLLEIDAASRTKVEDTRELLDNVQYKPTRGRFKVYLIDEVHMLSKHSFNALLKTLEEPPPHVKFLLATTDPQKLPITILSRCLQFSLKALTSEQIKTQLSHVLENESVHFESEAIVQLARAAHGSMRDALSLTDQAIAQGNNQITSKTVMSMLGLLDKNHILKLAKAIFEKNKNEAMETLENICAHAPDYSQVLSELQMLFHQISLTQIVPDVCKLETANPKAIYALSKLVTPEHIQLLYQIALTGKRDLPHAPDPLTGLQMTVIRLLAFSPAKNVDVNIETALLEEPQPEGKQFSKHFEGDVQASSTDVSEPSEPEAAHSDELADILNEQEKYKQEASTLLSDVPPSEQVTDSQLQDTINLINLSRDLVGANESSMTHEKSSHDDKDSKEDVLSRFLDAEHTQPENKTSEAEIPAINHSGKQVQSTPNQALLEITPYLKNGEKLTQASQIDKWSMVIQELEAYQIKGLTKQLLLKSNMIVPEPEITIRIDEIDKHLDEESSRTSITDAFCQYYNKSIEFAVEYGEVSSTPEQIQHRIDEMRQAHAKNVVDSDETIQEFIKAFDGNVLKDSIIPN